MARAAVVVEFVVRAAPRNVVGPELALPENLPLTLNDVGNGDEWWFDINKQLQSVVVGVAGEDRRQETPVERSPHVTVFSGAMGYESSPQQRRETRTASRASAVPSPSLSARAERRASSAHAIQLRLDMCDENNNGDDGSDSGNSDTHNDGFVQFDVVEEPAQPAQTAQSAHTAQPEQHGLPSFSTSLADAGITR